ncbi:MAG: hypothetical protein ABSG59_15865 [Verrucomicrobiota bacterium]|jgi:hypothetical protein
MRTAKQLTEAFDTIRNRTPTEAGGGQTGANLSLAQHQQSAQPDDWRMPPAARSSGFPIIYRKHLK